jgi:hypothetical protein
MSTPLLVEVFRQFGERQGAAYAIEPRTGFHHTGRS